MRMEHSIEIECSPRQLWPWLERPEKVQQWMKGIVGTRLTSPEPLGTGSTFDVDIKEGRKVRTYHFRMTEHQPYTRLGVAIGGGSFKGMEMAAEYRLTDLSTPQGGRTRVDYWGTCAMRGVLMKVMWAVFSLFAKMQLKGFFGRLKSLAEAECR